MKRILPLLLSISIIAAPLHAIEPEEKPKVAEIMKGQKSPFDGILYNYLADAQMSASREKEELECELTTSYLIRREKAKCDLAVNSAKVSLASTQKRYEAILNIKDNEINRLTKIAMNNPNSYNNLYFSGGVIIGVGLSVLIFYAAVQIEK